MHKMQHVASCKFLQCNCYWLIGFRVAPERPRLVSVLSFFFGERGIGANPGKALGGHMGHGGHPIIKCNYAQEGFPLFDSA